MMEIINNLYVEINFPGIIAFEKNDNCLSFELNNGNDEFNLIKTIILEYAKNDIDITSYQVDLITDDDKFIIDFTILKFEN